MEPPYRFSFLISVFLANILHHSNAIQVEHVQMTYIRMEDNVAEGDNNINEDLDKPHADSVLSLFNKDQPKRLEGHQLAGDKLDPLAKDEREYRVVNPINCIGNKFPAVGANGKQKADSKENFMSNRDHKGENSTSKLSNLHHDTDNENEDEKTVKENRLGSNRDERHIPNSGARLIDLQQHDADNEEKSEGTVKENTLGPDHMKSNDDKNKKLFVFQSGLSQHGEKNVGASKNTQVNINQENASEPLTLLESNKNFGVQKDIGNSNMHFISNVFFPQLKRRNIDDINCITTAPPTTTSSTTTTTTTPPPTTCETTTTTTTPPPTTCETTSTTTTPPPTTCETTTTTTAPPPTTCESTTTTTTKTTTTPPPTTCETTTTPRPTTICQTTPTTTTAPTTPPCVTQNAKDAIGDPEAMGLMS